MAENVLEGAYDELRAAAAEIEANAAFVELATSLRPRMGRYLAWDRLLDPDRTLVTQFMGLSCNVPVSYEGLYLRLVASFEAFVRRAVRDSVHSLNGSKICFANLREVIRNRNRHCVGRALATVYEPVDFLQLDFDRLCVEVGTCVPSAPSVTLSADAFAMAVGSASVDRIEGAFKLLGKDLQWDELGHSEDLKKALGTKKPRDTANAAKGRIGEIQIRRNAFAHTGVGAGAISAEDIRATALFLVALACELKRQLETHVVALCKV